MHGGLPVLTACLCGPRNSTAPVYCCLVRPRFEDRALGELGDVCQPGLVPLCGGLSVTGRQTKAIGGAV